MFVLPGYDAFLGFLLIAAAVPVLALVTNKLVAPKSRSGERSFNSITNEGVIIDDEHRIAHRVIVMVVPSSRESMSIDAP